MSKFSIIGWEANETFRHKPEWFIDEVNETLNTTDEIDYPHWVTDYLEEAVAQKQLLEQDYDDVSWYILIEE